MSITFGQAVHPVDQTNHYIGPRPNICSIYLEQLTLHATISVILSGPITNVLAFHGFAGLGKNDWDNWT